MITPEADYKDFLKHLIAFNTISDQSNLPMIDFLASFLEGHGFSTQRYFNDDNTKANLIARIGPETSGGIMLAGHTDVVPVEDQPWTTSPFSLVEQDGVLIGRGTSDMKGFIALICDVVEQLDLSQLKRPVFLVFTYDEEVGCFGAKRLKEALRKLADQIDFALIGEPTNFSLVNTHKGLQANRTHFTGKPAHSSCPHLGHSAIMAAAGFLQKLPEKLPKEEDERFTPASMTFNAGKIHGGNALNIIAEHCLLDWECRPLPHMKASSIETVIDNCAEEVSRETQVAIENEMVSFVPGLSATQNQLVIQVLKPFLPEDIPVTAAPFVTEAGIFQEVDIPTIVFGPGELEQAHQPDESVSIEAMERYRRFLMTLIDNYCNKHLTTIS
tara:strand:- start:180 stop:1334 length:1155 start_codon:yes stop_codon:yes gene_type:complete